MQLSCRENEKIKIEFQYVECDYTQKETSFVGGFNREYVFLKITNLSNEKINIDWELELWYENTCYTCEQEGIENRINPIEINANETLIGGCIKNNNLKIFSRFTEELSAMPGVSSIINLTKFELNNIRYE